MYQRIDLQGLWDFQLDEKKEGLKLPFIEQIRLPGTTSYARKGKKNEDIELGFLTDEYNFEGYAWYAKEINITEDISNKKCFLYLERTRITTVWINNIKIGTQKSLCTPHIYDLTGVLVSGKNTITILVDNTNYPTKGGHMTSPDTQTNWNGITGRIELQIFNEIYLSDLQLYPDISSKSVNIIGKINGINSEKAILSVSAGSFNSKNLHIVAEKEFIIESAEFHVNYELGEDALLWSEFEPNLYNLELNLKINGSVVDREKIAFGLREFKAEGDKFTINGRKTFLRGKHDALLFPRTGFAPTNVDEWLGILKRAKSYGINHYRFHTCCPPEAAFTAADILGIYLEPELPFWGTVTDENDENHNQEEQDYLINEGYSILKTFGNHPSFVMMSLGNELWGSKSKINELLGKYKEFDNRRLYTQGSNNFQFFPEILENEDFFCGVRFSRDRLFRGSYAMCDAPLGHVQTDRPGTIKDYDEQIFPPLPANAENKSADSEGTIEIQYGTGTKKVKTAKNISGIIPDIPVISHEIGQYAMYPNFKEIEKYTGSLKARNFEVFKKRLEEKGLEHLAEKYFQCSGKLAVTCYKEELEAAFRSKKLAGFQLLDLQDFSGQGTALVGILDAFLDPKGIVTEEEWRSFCSDAVLLARFSKYNYISKEEFSAHVQLTYFRNTPLNKFKVLWELKDNRIIYEEGEFIVSDIEDENYIDIGDIHFKMPVTSSVKKLSLALRIENMDIKKDYDLWLYPQNLFIDKQGYNIFKNFSSEAIKLLEKGENVILFPELDSLQNSIEGFFASDFWCYPMFRSISESMNRKEPVGTLGLLIDNTHPVFEHFPCEEYSTYQWWSIVMNSRSIILDGTPKKFNPIVQIIDNFERNHKLGLMFECKVLNGKLFLCACNFDQIIDEPEARQLLYSILKYVQSEKFEPDYKMELSELKEIVF